MKRGEVATSTIVWISVALIVIVLVLAGVVTKISEGNSDLDKERCRTTNDADGDGKVDTLDPCPCGDINSPPANGCRGCPKYEACEPGP